jgi:hypothetical protein
VALPRRLAGLEADSDAVERVVRWLAEAQQYPRFEAYMHAVMDRGDQRMPIDRVADESAAAVRARKHERGRDIEAEVRETTRAVVFRMHLAFSIVVRTHEALDREVLTYAALTAYSLLALHPPKERPVMDSAQVRDLFLIRMTAVLALDQARRRLQDRYLGGAEVLFAAERQEWALQLERTQEATRHAMRLAELDGHATVDDDRPLVPESAIEAAMADIAEPSRIKTLDEMGEWDASQRRARSWLTAIQQRGS